MKKRSAFLPLGILLLLLISTASAQDAKIMVLNPKGNPPVTGGETLPVFQAGNLKYMISVIVDKWR